MTDYLMLIIADILLAVNFAITKVYQKNQGVSLIKGLKFNAFLGAFTALIFAVMNGFKIEASWFSILMALLQALFVAAYTILGFRVMKTEKISLYTMFLMTGGMVMPYLWGLAFLGEPFSLLRTIGLIVIIASIIITNMDSSRISPKQILLCSAIFILNGFTSIVSKEHQISPMAVSSDMFVFWSGAMKAVICLLLYIMVSRRKTETDEANAKIPSRLVLLIFLSALSSGVSYLMQLFGAKNLPATVLYPIITGGSIFFTAFAGRICFGEKFTVKSSIGIILCFIGTCMFL